MTRTLTRAAVAVVLVVTLGGGGFVLGAAAQTAADVSTALTRGIRLGQTVGVQGLRSGTFRVVGLVGSGAADGSSDSLVLVSTPTARRLLGPDAGR